jgi:adenosylmethionine-8-amino-7-oxononanoate aminotransferase
MGKRDPHQPERDLVWLPYTQMATAPASLVVESTEGALIQLQDGRQLVDGIASWWTACHGYNHPHIRKAIEHQLRSVPHVMLGGLIHEPVQRLSAELATILPGDLQHSFFSESGSVAVEVALKMAIQYWLNQGQTRRSRFLSFRGGYHGDTTGAMSVCDPEEGMHSLFSGLLPQQLVVDLPTDGAGIEQLSATMASHRDELAGVVMEPLVQAAGGLKFHSAEILAAVAGLCRQHDLLFVLDEIATGFGRTGTLFACEQANVAPDIMTLSKALTGGTLPLAVTVATPRVFDAFKGGPEQVLMHGPTFTGNPLGCAAALASLELFASEPRLTQVGQIEAQLSSELAPCADLPGVVDVRVRGAIGVVQLSGEPPVTALRQRFVEHGVWVRPFGNVVYLMPAFTIETAQLQQLTTAICAVVGEWSRGLLADG